MKWKKRKAEIDRLRRKHPVIRVVSMPTLSCERASTSLPSLTSSGVAKICSKRTTTPKLDASTSVLVGTPHKQGPMVMFRSELPWAGGRKQ